MLVPSAAEVRAVVSLQCDGHHSMCNVEPFARTSSLQPVHSCASFNARHDGDEIGHACVGANRREVL